MQSDPAVQVESLSHSYGARQALVELDLRTRQGEVFGLLGPNGGGKTTLFRILTTAQRVQRGRVEVFSLDVSADADRVRGLLGVVFQSPSLDAKLTVAENLRHHGRLYGLRGAELTGRIAEMLGLLGLTDRAGDFVETLSGGLARRAELAKALLHRPPLLILDEPSTGLDPGARRDLWQYFKRLSSDGVTLLLTTHLIEEAERCDRVGILDAGRLIAVGSPAELRAEVGGDVITLQAAEPERLAETIRESTGLPVTVLEGSVRLEHPDSFSFLPRLGELAGSAIESLSVSKPTLEDVFIQRTGHRFWAEEQNGG